MTIEAHTATAAAARIGAPPAQKFAWPPGAAPAAVAVAATIAAWLRLAPLARGTLWAEDLRNFLKADVQTGLASSLLRPYGGYLQLVPRLLAALVAHLVPVDRWAPAVALCACAAAGIVAAVVFVSARQILGNAPLGVAAAAITVLDPLAPHEVLGNLANLHWFVIWVTPWLLLYRPPTRKSAWLLGVIMLFAALSEFDVVLFLPLLTWRFKDRRLWPVRVTFLIGCLAEVIAELVAPRTHPAHLTLSGADVAAGYLINVVLSILTPVRLQIGALLRPDGTAIALPLVASATVLLGYVFLRGDARLRVLAAVIAILSPGLFVAAVQITPRREYDYAHLASAQLADPWLVRYGVVPSMLLLALIPLAIAAYRGAHPGRIRLRARLGLGAGVAVLAVALLAHSGPTNDQLRANGPTFAPQVLEAIEDCRSAPPHQLEVLTAAPAAKWRMSLSCAQLTASVAKSVSQAPAF